MPDVSHSDMKDYIAPAVADAHHLADFFDRLSDLVASQLDGWCRRRCGPDWFRFRFRLGSQVGMQRDFRQDVQRGS
jgi:hypothetical protein